MKPQVLPLVEDTEQPVEDDLFKMEDIKLEVMRARGAGGQVLPPSPFRFGTILNQMSISMSTKLNPLSV